MRSLKQQVIDAIETENIREFEDLLEENFDEILWAKMEGNQTALDLIIKKGKGFFFTLILEELNTKRTEKIPAEMLNHILDRALALAYFYKKKEIVELALKNPYGLCAKNINPALPQAVYEDDLQGARELIGRGACVNAEGFYFVGQSLESVLGTPLAAALKVKSSSMINFLLKQGAYLFSSKVCIVEHSDAIKELFPENEISEIDYLLKLASLKMKIFSAISENDITVLYFTLNQALKDFPRECQRLLWSKNPRGCTPMEEALEDDKADFVEALTHFNELSNKNSSHLLPREAEPMLTAEELDFLKQPVALEVFSEEINGVRFDDIFPSLLISSLEEDEDSPSNMSDYPRPPSCVPSTPSPSFFSGRERPRISLPWQGTKETAPSAPPLEYLLEDDAKRESEFNPRSCTIA